MSVWLVRHAQPCIASGVCYGALDMAADPHATELAARQLASVLPQALTVQVSTLQRCEQLAQCLRGLRPDLVFKKEARLVEMNFGQWEGVPWSEVPRAAMERWTADFGDHLFGGAESANQLLQRVAAVWADTLGSAPPSQQADAVWITHAGVIRAATLLAQGVARLEHAAQWPRTAPGFGQWTVLAGGHQVISAP